MTQKIGRLSPWKDALLSGAMLAAIGAILVVGIILARTIWDWNPKWWLAAGLGALLIMILGLAGVIASVDRDGSEP